MPVAAPRVLEWTVRLSLLVFAPTPLLTNFFLGGFCFPGFPFSVQLYFMGIIDILTLYNVGKKLENFGKSLKYNEADISAVNPTKYADRFKAFIEHALR